MDYKLLMSNALQLADQAQLHNDVPVGALVVNQMGEIIGRGKNEREKSNDPLAHAELMAIKDAAKNLNSYRFDDLTLVVTLEPCAMCAGAIAQSRFSRLVFGAFDEKAGAVGSVWDLIRDSRALTKIEVVSGVLQDECAQLLKDFFANKR
ncbi:MAG: nucleoside deaminase [Actinobacteria bacterium]|nr:nucleoside deaminase [Actinomycetota bacterium]